MPVVIALAECIARPDQPAGDLIRHCEAVAGGCGRKDGRIPERLAFLAGLCHDLAKAAPAWQDYIHSKGAINKGPPHAPTGAALFAVWAEDLVPKWERSPKCRDEWIDLALDWARVIDHHHGRLDDLGDAPPWFNPGVLEEHQPATLLATCDLAGLDALARKHFPECSLALADFPRRLETVRKKWAKRHKDRGVIVNDTPKEQKPQFGLRLAELGAKLIFADRSDAADWERDDFDPADVYPALIYHARECHRSAAKALKDGASPAIVAKRQELQDAAVNNYLAHPANSVYTLFLPTGYGKTLTGLRVALEALRVGRCSRILYIAPYISILSQAAKVIRDATGLSVFVHHHLSILGERTEFEYGKARPADDPDKQKEDHQTFDLLDTWQAPILATTFNQLFRALFPSRAQECLRIPALDAAFVFIDEPQVVDPQVWCAFLRALAVTARARGCQVLFATATLPPLEDGLGEVGVPLAQEVAPVVSRYVLCTRADSWTAAEVAGEARQRFAKVKGVGVMLNTVRDAVEVFRRVVDGDGKPSGPGPILASAGWHFLAATMLPGHKAGVIAAIRRRLDAKEPTGVVSTQVLEAGVDLSFPALLRARSTFQSIAQTAGRGNRHGESEPAEVIVFPFHRDDGKDSRRFVYKDSTFVAMTDKVLATNPELAESDLSRVLKEYYDSCWNENDRRESLGWFTEAAQGKWSALASREPFGGDYPRIDVLIPGAEVYLAEHHRAILRGFDCESAAELLDKYARGTLNFGVTKKEKFVRRKQVSALLRQFTVAMPVKVADNISEKVTDRWGEELWLRRLSSASNYSSRTGLAHCLCEQLTPEEDVITLLI